MREYLQGWFAIYDLKDQCGDCSEVVTEGRMVSCQYGQSAFPSAHNCPRYRLEQEDDN